MLAPNLCTRTTTKCAGRILLPTMSRGLKLGLLNKKSFDATQLQRQESVRHKELVRKEESCRNEGVIERSGDVNIIDDFGWRQLDYSDCFDSSQASVTDCEPLIGYLSVKQGEKAAIWSRVMFVFKLHCLCKFDSKNV